LGTAFVITALTSIGLPGTSGFVGEFLALVGTFQTHPWIGGIAATGVIFAAYYMLPMVQRIWYNRLDRDENRNVKDLSRRELAILAPMLALMIWIGVYPTPILERMEPAVQAVLARVESAASANPGLAEASVELELAGTPDGTANDAEEPPGLPGDRE
jgi:NADH-quinone oxidoreductase subunit M